MLKQMEEIKLWLGSSLSVIALIKYVTKKKANKTAKKVVKKIIV